MKYTQTEIKLCKEIAKKYRKKIEYGDWYIWRLKTWRNPDTFEPPRICGKYEIVDIPENETYIPLWTLEDCLGFLREKRWLSYHFYPTKQNQIELSIVRIPFKFTTSDHIIKVGDTLLEACLKAVLAILEEK